MNGQPPDTPSRNVRAAFFVTVSLLCLAADQASKWVVAHRLAPGQEISRLGGAIRVRYAENDGGFLGLGAELPPGIRFAAFVVLVTVALALVGLYALRGRGIGRIDLLAASLIVGGGLGNLLDRLRFGTVRDFLVLGAGGLHTGIFNAADLAITCGTLIIFAVALVRIFSGRRRPTVRRNWFEK
jgi:signal peptidase II